MKHRYFAQLLAVIFQFGALSAVADDAAVAQELEQYWLSVASYLAVGDYEGVVSTYHPDAVLVSESLGTSYPIAKALKRWKPGIMDTKAGKAMSMVEFKVTDRLFSETTSHEKGIFHFKSGPVGEGASEEEMAEAYIHFEALLLKDGVWTMVMEYQKHEATQAEWESVRPAQSAP